MPHALALVVLCALFLYQWNHGPVRPEYGFLSTRMRDRYMRHVQTMYVVGTAIVAISLHAVATLLMGS